MTTTGSDPHRAQHRRQYLAAFVVSLGAFALGCAFGWSAPAEPRILEDDEMEFNLTGEQFAWAVAMVGLGGAVISIPAGLTVKAIGARNTLLVFVVPAIVGWALIIAAWNVSMLVVGRLFIGFGGGAFCMVVPIYIGEMASAEIRGAVGAFFQQMINLGILYAYSLGLAMDVFRLSIVCGVVPIVYGMLLLFMPNTPTYLMLKNNEAKAVTSIKWLRGVHFDAASEVNDIRQQQRQAAFNKRSVWQSFRQPATVRALVVMLGLMFFFQASGINVVLFYSTSIFQASNVDIRPEVATIMLGSLQVVGTLLSTLVVDRAGRRILLLASGGVMFITVLTLGVYLQLLATDQGSVTSLGWLPVLALCLYVTSFSVGFGPVPWLMLGEIFANDVKGLASALANITSFAMSFALSRLFPLARDEIGSGPTFMIFSGFCVLAMVFVVLIVPETKGKSLGEIQTMLEDYSFRSLFHKKKQNMNL